jgi:hypothetical protein
MKKINSIFLIFLGTILTWLIISFIKDKIDPSNFEWIIFSILLLISMSPIVIGLIKLINTFKNMEE